MAIPKSLKPIPKETAQRIIHKHSKDGTGSYEYPNNTGDFIYNSGKSWWLIRNVFQDNYERGKLCL